jgi:NO-binding membrane sensor protein with MHYT domain
MSVTYNPVLVFASSTIAILAAYITLEVSSKLSASTETSRTFWLVSGAITLGSGIWAMHFVAMLAFSIPISITYNLLIVLVSLLAPVLVSFQALSIVSRPQPTLTTILIGSLIIGTGIIIMHYSGMAAMQMPANLHYNSMLLVLSTIIAVTVSFAALILSLLFRKSQGKKLLKALSAVVMGGAVMSMHYTGMAAAIFEPNPNKIVPPSGLDNASLATLVCFYTVIVMGLVLSFIYLEQKRET